MVHLVQDDYIFYGDRNISAAPTAYATTPGHTVVRLRAPLFTNASNSGDILLIVKRIAKAIAGASSAQRCGLAYDGSQFIHLLPLHGLGAA
jgi:diadenosine tetraphosphate (Ap4A) HIT family hydrolase